MSDNITVTQKKQGQILAAGIGQVGLDYKPFDFRAKRGRQAALARVADAAGYKGRGDKYAACGVSLGFGLNMTGRHLTAANFCNQRFCAICTARRARKNAKRLGRVLSAAQERESCRYLFVTLAARNVSGADLASGIDALLKAWFALMRSKRIKGMVLGSFRALEVTRSGSSGTYHPHIHAIWAVREDYFGDHSQYLTQRELVRCWQQALHCSYAPTAHISALYSKAADGQRVGPDRGTDARDAVREAAKYSVKDSDILTSGLSVEQQADIYDTLLRALDHRRMASYSGVLKLIARELRLEDIEAGDLIHADEDDEDPDKIAYEIMERWAWHDSLSEYVCEDVYLPGEVL